MIPILIIIAIHDYVLHIYILLTIKICILNLIIDKNTF